MKDIDNTCNVKDDCKLYPDECHSTNGFGCFGYSSKTIKKKSVINEKNDIEYTSNPEGVTGNIGIIG
jgi:retron-type reverse transcriptase